MTKTPLKQATDALIAQADFLIDNATSELERIQAIRLKVTAINLDVYRLMSEINANPAEKA